MNIINELDLAIVARAKKSWHGHHPKSAHSVSNYPFEEDGIFYGTCLRAQYYDWMEVEPLWNTIKATRCYAREFGPYVQLFIEDLLHERDFLISKEIKLPEIKVPELTRPIHGRIDDVLSKMDSLTQYGLEIKSCHGRAFSSPRFGIMYQGAKRDNIYQVGFYKKYYPEAVKEWHLTYFSREDFNRKDFTEGATTFPQEFDFKWWIKLEDYLANRVLPTRKYRVIQAQSKKKPVPERERFSCSWCDYNTVCWDVHKGLEGEG